MKYIWSFVHNCIAHPLLFFTGNHRLAVRFHDWSSHKMHKAYPKLYVRRTGATPMTPEQMIARIERESRDWRRIADHNKEIGMNNYAASLARSVLSDIAREFRQQLEGAGGRGVMAKHATKGDGHEKLWLWFSLSYASFCVLPRVLMHEMPDEWQGKMADLLNEYDAAHPNMPDMGTTVRITDLSGKLIKCPEELLNYRHPDLNWVSRIKEDNPQ